MPAGNRKTGKAQVGGGSSRTVSSFALVPGQAANSAATVAGGADGGSRRRLPPPSPPEDRASVRDERAPYARKCFVLAGILALVCIASLPIGANVKEACGFDQVINALALWVQTSLDSLASGTQYTSMELMERCPAYYQVLGRVAITFVALASGAMTALSGSLYQMVFRNPIAAPTMLGVGNGVTLGVVVLVVLFGAAAPYMTGARYVLCYLGALAVLAAVVGLSLAIGKGKLVTVDMLLVGTVVSALAGQAIVFFTYCVFDEDALELFNAINEMLSVSTEPLSLAVLAIAFAVAVVPIALLRFKLNAVAFDEAEIRLLGLNPTLLRFAALGCATVMIITAQVQVGTIVMVALVAPYVARSVFGAEFTRQFWASMLVGALLVVVCCDAASLASMGLYAFGVWLDVPVGMVANLVCLPLFAWVMAASARAWE